MNVDSLPLAFRIILRLKSTNILVWRGDVNEFVTALMFDCNTLVTSTRRIAAIVALCGLGLVGCASPDASSSAGGETAACGNETSTTLQGAGLGAILGGITGLIAGRSGTSTAIGAGAGGLVGGIAGHFIASGSCHQSMSEAELDHDIAEANHETARYEADTRYYDNRAAYAQAEAAHLQAEYNAGSISANNFAARMQSLRNTQKYLQQQIADLQNERVALNQEAQEAGPNGGKLNEDEAALTQTQQRYQHDLDSISSSLEAVPQG